MEMFETLKGAVSFIIKQNKEIGYIPHRFISITQNGNAGNLEEIISRLVLKAELLEEIEGQIKEHSDMITIEDLIMGEENNFGFSENVVEIARANLERFNQIRQDVQK